MGEPLHHGRVQDSDHILAFHPPLHLQRHQFPAELIADRQPFEPPPILGLIEDKVVAPHLVDPLRAQPLGAALAVPEPLALALPARHFQALLPPQPLHPLGVDLHPARRKSAVAMR